MARLTCQPVQHGDAAAQPPPVMRAQALFSPKPCLTANPPTVCFCNPASQRQLHPTNGRPSDWPIVLAAMSKRAVSRRGTSRHFHRLLNPSAPGCLSPPLSSLRHLSRHSTVPGFTKHPQKEISQSHPFSRERLREPPALCLATVATCLIATPTPLRSSFVPSHRLCAQTCFPRLYNLRS